VTASNQDYSNFKHKHEFDPNQWIPMFFSAQYEALVTSSLVLVLH